MVGVDGSVKLKPSQGIRMVAADRFPADRTLSGVLFITFVFCLNRNYRILVLKAV